MRRRKARLRPRVQRRPSRLRSAPDLEDIVRLLLKAMPPEVRIDPRIVRRYLARVVSVDEVASFSGRLLRRPVVRRTLGEAPQVVRPTRPVPGR
jgi:hypothetical protein